MQHYQFCTGDLSQEEALRAAVATWPAGVRPVVHWSESPPEEVLFTSSSLLCTYANISCHALHPSSAVSNCPHCLHLVLSVRRRTPHQAPTLCFSCMSKT